MTRYTPRSLGDYRSASTRPNPKQRHPYSLCLFSREAANWVGVRAVGAVLPHVTASPLGRVGCADGAQHVWRSAVAATSATRVGLARMGRVL